jgi:hypothetical protein
MTGRAKGESLMMVHDGDVQILHLSQQLKAIEQRCRHLLQAISREVKSNVLLLECNDPFSVSFRSKTPKRHQLVSQQRQSDVPVHVSP